MRSSNKNLTRRGLAAFNRSYLVPTIKVWGKALYDLGASADSLEFFNKKRMVHRIFEVKDSITVSK